MQKDYFLKFQYIKVNFNFNMKNLKINIKTLQFENFIMSPFEILTFLSFQYKHFINFMTPFKNLHYFQEENFQNNLVKYMNIRN